MVVILRVEFFRQKETKFSGVHTPQIGMKASESENESQAPLR
jgi:hypothetical protein